MAFLLSGSAGLVHEIVWVRLLGHMFGVTEMAVATVLAAFMGGLALGSWWLGHRSARVADARRTYALLEIGIGAAALLIPLLLDLTTPLYGVLWREFHPSFAVFSLIRLVVATALLLVPTVLMGATLPVLAEYFASLEEHRIAPQWLYTLNLAGAVLGTAVGGFVLLPTLGLSGTIVVGAALNVVIGLGVLRLPALPRRAAPATAVTEDAATTPGGLLVLAAFLSGALSFATQVSWTRVLTLVIGSTTHAFTTVLLVYLVALGLGSSWASRRGARTPSVGTDLAVVHLLAALGLLGAIVAVNALPGWYLRLYEIWAPQVAGGGIARGLVIAGAVLLPAVACAGTIFPLVLVGAVPRGAHAGPAVGRLYAVNTLGAIVGSVLAGFLFVPLLGTQPTLVGVVVLTAAMGLVFAAAGPRPAWLLPAAGAAAALVAFGLLTRPPWSFRDLHSGVAEPGRFAGPDATGPGAPPGALPSGDAPALSGAVLYEREGPTASVLVAALPNGYRSLVINARANASDGPVDMGTQVLLAHIPLLLAPRRDDVFIVGWGSGITVGSATQSPAKRITAVELEPAVVEASRFFDHVNHRPLADPRVRLYEDDARHVLLASDTRWDVIISEPPHPWVAGVANLFTQDFYRAARRRLRPDGVFAQWLQTYQISLEVYRSILATFQSIFPHVLVFKPPEGADTILVGSGRPLTLDLAELDRRWSHEPTRADLARLDMRSPEFLLACVYLDAHGVRAVSSGARINTDDNMYVEFQGARDMERDLTVSSHATIGTLAHNAATLESVLTDPAALLESPERLLALADGLELGGRDATALREFARARSGAGVR